MLNGKFRRRHHQLRSLRRKKHASGGGESSRLQVTNPSDWKTAEHGLESDQDFNLKDMLSKQILANICATHVHTAQIETKCLILFVYDLQP